MKRIMALLAILIFVLASGCEKEAPRISSGDRAPDFTLNDVSGKPVMLSDYKGDIVLLEFWATWCPPCVMAIPELNDLQKKYLDKGVVILGVSVDDDLDALKYFHEETPMDYPVLFDSKNVSNDFGVYTVPTTIVIGRDGTILERHMGYAPDVLDELVQEILAKDKQPEPGK
jgi:peroxiredoxin